MTTYYRKISGGNWTDSAGWNDLANGTGNDFTATGSNEAGHTFDCNALACTLDCSPTLTLLTSSNAAGCITVSGTRSITGAITHASTGTSGMFRIGSGVALTINGLTTNSAAGYCYVLTSTGALTLYNPSATALSVSAGIGIYSASGSGAVTVTGNIVGASVKVLDHAGSATITINGDITTGQNYTGFLVAGTTQTTINGNVYCNGISTSVSVYISAAGAGAVVTLNGAPYVSNAAGAGEPIAVFVGNGTLNWGGARTLEAGASSRIDINSGTINLTAGGVPLTLSNSGTFVLVRRSGTVNATGAKINNMTATAQAACLWASNVTINGPTLPAAGNTLTDSGAFGYAGAPITPTLKLPGAVNVWYGSGTYGNPSSPVTPLKRASSIPTTEGSGTYLVAADLALGVVVDDVGPGTASKNPYLFVPFNPYLLIP